MNRASRLVRRLGKLALRHSPPSLLVVAAKSVAPTATLAVEPGWSFATAQRLTGNRASARRALWTAFRDRHIRRPVTIRWYDDLRLRLYLGNDVSLCLYVGGSFEPNEFVFLSGVLEPGMVFVDGGANDGLYSLFAARRVGRAGRVLAVEPSSREYGRLLANVRLNRLENVTAMQVALGASPGRATLAIADEGHEGQNTVGPRVSNPKVATIAHEDVELQTLDELVASRRLERLDVVKLDVEGSEVRAIEGARQAVERFRPLIVLEADDQRLESQGSTKGELLDALGQLGYRLNVFDGMLGTATPTANARGAGGQRRRGAARLAAAGAVTFPLSFGPTGAGAGCARCHPRVLEARVDPYLHAVLEHGTPPPRCVGDPVARIIIGAAPVQPAEKVPADAVRCRGCGYRCTPASPCPQARLLRVRACRPQSPVCRRRASPRAPCRGEGTRCSSLGPVGQRSFSVERRRRSDPTARRRPRSSTAAASTTRCPYQSAGAPTSNHAVPSSPATAASMSVAYRGSTPLSSRCCFIQAKCVGSDSTPTTWYGRALRCRSAAATSPLTIHLPQPAPNHHDERELSLGHGFEERDPLEVLLVRNRPLGLDQAGLGEVAQLLHK